MSESLDAPVIPARSTEQIIRSTRRRFAVSVLLLLSTLALWGGSLLRSETLWLSTWRGQFNMAQSSNGILTLCISSHSMGVNESFVVRHLSSAGAVRRTGDLALADLDWRTPTTPGVTPEPRGLVRAKFSVEQYALSKSALLIDVTSPQDIAGLVGMLGVNDDERLNAVLVSVPYWLLTPAALLIALLSARRFLQVRRRRRKGLCVECELNIRHGNLSVCPECGTTLARTPGRRVRRVVPALLVGGLLATSGFVLGNNLRPDYPIERWKDQDLATLCITGTRASVNLKRVPLGEVLAILSDRYKVRFAVDWVELSERRIFRVSDMKISVENIELIDVLQRLEDESGGSVLAEVDAEAVRLTSERALLRQAEYRAYDLSRLATQTDVIWKAGLTTDIPDVAQTKDGRLNAVQGISMLLQRRVRPHNWSPSETWSKREKLGQIRSQGMVLLVRQSPFGHVLIRRELTRLQTEADQIVETLKKASDKQK